jgi:hypothetical protein
MQSTMVYLYTCTVLRAYRYDLDIPFTSACTYFQFRCGFLEGLFIHLHIYYLGCKRVSLEGGHGSCYVTMVNSKCSICFLFGFKYHFRYTRSRCTIKTEDQTRVHFSIEKRTPQCTYHTDVYLNYKLSLKINLMFF